MQAPRQQPNPQKGGPQPSQPSYVKEAEYLDGPAYGAPVRPVKVQATPSWSEIKPPPLHARCSNFRFVIWVGTILLLLTAAIGLSVVMVVVKNNKDDGDSSSSGGSSGGSSSGGHGGGGSSGGGSGGGSIPPVNDVPFTPPPGWTALWWDEFDGTSLDTSKWNYDKGTGNWGWGNNEEQSYTDNEENVRVKNGVLSISAQKDGNDITSGRINTLGNAAFYPGMAVGNKTYNTVRIETRAQLPNPGQGLWPAIWLFPVKLEYGKWAASGELDLMESINAMTSITQGIHYGGPSPQNQMLMQFTPRADGQSWGGSFTTFSVDWGADTIIFYINGAEVRRMYSRTIDPTTGWYTTYKDAPPNAPFTIPFYLIMNLAIGGLFPGPSDSTLKFPATLSVDYVRVMGQ